MVLCISPKIASSALFVRFIYPICFMKFLMLLIKCYSVPIAFFFVSSLHFVPFFPVFFFGFFFSSQFFFFSRSLFMVYISLCCHYFASRYKINSKLNETINKQKVCILWVLVQFFVVRSIANSVWFLISFIMLVYGFRATWWLPHCWIKLINVVAYFQCKLPDSN